MSGKRFAGRAVRVLAASFLALAMSLSVAIAGDFMPGDVNNDRNFDMADSVVLRRALAGLGPGITQDVTCGNGLLDPNEDCDLGELAGQTCVDVGFSFGTLSCGAGCIFDTNGCTDTRFVDNGDGTVSDHQLGLMWEKKETGSGCLHCVEDTYPWTPGLESGGPITPSMFDWLSGVNGLTGNPNEQPGLAGHGDWRIPSIPELQAILDCSFGMPCIDPILGPTASSAYWSSATFDGNVASGWGVGFFDGLVGVANKAAPFRVRAVRNSP